MVKLKGSVQRKLGWVKSGFIQQYGGPRIAVLDIIVPITAEGDGESR